ncbi:unnamed protein product [Urochloa humidicola]
MVLDPATTRNYYSLLLIEQESSCARLDVLWAAATWSFVLDVLAEKERKKQRDLPREFSNEISVTIIQDQVQKY